MSVDQYQKAVNGLDKEIADLEKKKAAKDKDIASLQNKIVSTQKSINKNTSQSFLNSKRRQIASCESDIAKKSKDSADLGKKIAEKRKKRSDAYLKLQKEQQNEQKKQDRASQRLQASYENCIDELQQQLAKSVVLPQQNNSESEEEYDVFVSHAWEDKEDFVDEFVDELKKQGLKVWYDTNKLKWGDSMREKIDKGLAKSRYGVVVLSPNYIAEHKYWTKAELNGLFQVESINGKVILAIKKEAEAKIVFCREQIIAKANKKSLIHSDQTVNKQLQAVQDQFKDYQLALYTLAFSSFLDVMLVGNYDKEYLSGISEKLDDYSMKYRELYTQCYEEISGYSSTSIQSSLLKGLSKTTKAVGKIVERIPVVGDTQADETLIAAGEKLSDIGTEKIRKQMRQLIERQSNFVRPFIDNIDTVNRLNNNPVQLLVDKDNLYIATIA